MAVGGYFICEFSIDKGNDPFAVQRGELLAELFLVSFVERVGTGSQVGEGPPCKYGSGPGPGGDGESDPLGQLSEIVGRRDVAEHSSARDVVTRVARFAQMADNVIRVQVDYHAGNKDCGTDIEIGFCEPIGIIVFRRDVEDPTSLHQGVERIEYHSHQDDSGRHFRVSPHQQRKDKGALQVVALEEDEQGERSGLPCAVGEEPENGHGDEDRTLHQNPADLVRDRESVFPVE